MSAHAVDLVAGAIATAAWLALAGPLWRDLWRAAASVAAGAFVALAVSVTTLAEAVSPASP